jgi:hypothetical protein
LNWLPASYLLLAAAACARSGGDARRDAAASAVPTARPTPAPAASTPGPLAIRETGLSSASHGVRDEPWRARFRVENQTSQPLSVRVSELALRSDEASLASADRTQPVRVTNAHAPGLAVSVQDGVATFTAPPHQELELWLEGDLAQALRVMFHVTYWHEATFSAGTARVVGRGDTMFFRHPRGAVPR